MLKIKLLIIFIGWFLLCTFISGFSQGSWEKVDVPTIQNLSSVFFVDSLYGWAVGDSGTIIHTADGANSWVIQESQTENDIVDVFFLNKNLGWASSFKYSSLPYGTLLLKTTDGGQNWTGSLYPEDNIFITCILFQDLLNGWMGGMPHALLKTSNGGIDWQQATVDTSILAFFPVLNIQFYDENYGYACGGIFDIAGVIWRTTNGGEKWYAIDPSYAPADEVHQLHLYDSMHVMGVGGDPDFGYGVALIRSWNGGIDWDYEELGIQGNAFDIDFRTEAEAWCPLGPHQKLIYSLDSGNTWMQIPTPDSSVIFDMIFPDSLHGYAVGRDGTVIKYIPPVNTSVPDLFESQNQKLIIRNYPNPFKSTTRIEFGLSSNETETQNLVKVKPKSIELIVYNSYGKKITELKIDELLHEKSYFDFNASSLPGGIYYYHISITYPGTKKPFSASQRMILIQ